MPGTDTSTKVEGPHDSVGDKEKDRDRSAKSKNSSAKSKDLSHVPCKFFRVGSCTAGSSCPFSHTILEPGQQKDVCAWFVKGNCKFGHKCALAHILPGQSMAMDRKNKKAAQAAATAVNASSMPGRDIPRASRSQRSGGQGSQGSSTGPRNTLLSGSTAPTRSTSRPPIPMPLKATLSPSTPAPPVQNTDFESYGLPDESNKLPSAPAQGKTSSPPNTADLISTFDHDPSDATRSDRPEGPSVTELNFLAAAVRRVGKLPVDDLGPIGSPPRVAAAVRGDTIRTDTPPQAFVPSTSPFSAPGAQSIFALPEVNGADFKTRSGLSASLGAMMWAGDEKATRSLKGMLQSSQDEAVVEDGDLEEFIPGSLSELLTPEERSRRFSRTYSGRPAQNSERDGVASQSSAETAHHRHSRSVPAPSLLQDIRSIWADSGINIARSPDTGAGISASGGGLGNGTPSSFQSNTGFGGRGGDEALVPSNASAAFLPGLHHFINAKTTNRSSLTSALPPLYSHSTAVAASHHPTSALVTRNGIAQSPSRTSTISTYENTLPGDAYHPQSHRPVARPIPADDLYSRDNDDGRNAFSPATRALQAHAPGQSLPQGLAAGYSRIHALPPPPTISSPSNSAAFSPARSAGFPPAIKALGHSSRNSTEWHSASPPNAVSESLSGVHTPSVAPSPLSNGSFGGLNNMFSRLSYSAAASKSTPTAAPVLGTRNISGRSVHSAQGPLSPLSGPVLTGDDDVLFSMDG